MKDEKKKERLLTEAEKKRLDQFEKLSEDLQAQGYTRHFLTIGMGFANVFSIVLLIPLFLIGMVLVYLLHNEIGYSRVNIATLLVSLVVLIIVHELIHGLCWSFFTPHRFGDIAFGFMKTTLTPYCTCSVPLKKYQHIFGAVMPLILLGIIPMIVGIATGNTNVLFLGIIMADGAAGDILVIWRILSYKSKAKETIYMDHPTQAGAVVFER